jgi:hypothetical protein
VDVIQEVVHPVRKAIRTPQDLQSVLSSLEPGDYVSLGVFNTARSERLIVNLRLGRD